MNDKKENDQTKDSKEKIHVQRFALEKKTGIFVTLLTSAVIISQAYIGLKNHEMEIELAKHQNDHQEQLASNANEHEKKLIAEINKHSSDLVEGFNAQQSELFSSNEKNLTKLEDTIKKEFNEQSNLLGYLKKDIEQLKENIKNGDDRTHKILDEINPNLRSIENVVSQIKSLEKRLEELLENQRLIISKTNNKQIILPEGELGATNNPIHSSEIK